MAGEMQSYLIRSLLSEGKVRYVTVEKTKAGLNSRLIEREGPTGLIVTTTAVRLHPENETRLLSLTVNDSPAQTKAVLLAHANGSGRGGNVEPWHDLQAWLAGRTDRGRGPLCPSARRGDPARRRSTPPRLRDRPLVDPGACPPASRDPRARQRCRHRDDGRLCSRPRPRHGPRLRCRGADGLECHPRDGREGRRADGRGGRDDRHRSRRSPRHRQVVGIASGSRRARARLPQEPRGPSRSAVPADARRPAPGRSDDPPDRRGAGAVARLQW